jgi:predicted nucleotidyltransferase
MVAPAVKTTVPLPMDRIEAFCRRHNVIEFAVFGSVLRDDFRPDSDIDVLVTFDPRAKPSLLTFAGMENELEEILGRSVDLSERCGLEQCLNPYIRRAVLDSLRVIYAR